MNRGFREYQIYVNSQDNLDENPLQTRGEIKELKVQLDRPIRNPTLIRLNEFSLPTPSFDSHNGKRYLFVFDKHVYMELTPDNTHYSTKNIFFYQYFNSYTSFFRFFKDGVEYCGIMASVEEVVDGINMLLSATMVTADYQEGTSTRSARYFIKVCHQPNFVNRLIFCSEHSADRVVIKGGTQAFGFFHDNTYTLAFTGFMDKDDVYHPFTSIPYDSYNIVYESSSPQPLKAYLHNIIPDSREVFVCLKEPDLIDNEPSIRTTLKESSPYTVLARVVITSDGSVEINNNAFGDEQMWQTLGPSVTELRTLSIGLFERSWPDNDNTKDGRSTLMPLKLLFTRAYEGLSLGFRVRAPP